MAFRRRPAFPWLLAPLLAAASIVLVAGCATGPDVSVPTPDVPDTVTVTSPVAGDGDDLPARYTCDGAGEFPAVAWSDLPDGTVAVAVVVNDPDAPGGDFVHRFVADLAPDGSLPDAATPPDALELRGSSGEAGWTPPCPPTDDGPHRYVVTVYALNRPIRIPDTAQTQTALVTVTEAAIGRGELTWYYGRG